MDTFKSAEEAGVGATVSLALPGGLYVVGTIAEINRDENSVTMKDGRSVHFAPPAAAPADVPEEEEP